MPQLTHGVIMRTIDCARKNRGEISLSQLWLVCRDTTKRGKPMGTDTRVPINHHAAIVIINDGRQHQYIPVYRDDTGWHTWKEGARIVQHASMDAARRFIQAKEQEEH